MSRRECSKQNRWQNQSGFTLVEVLITIVILALITIPILSYFSDAAKHNARSRTQQNATVAAQDTLESLKTVDYQITDSTTLLAKDATWTLDGAVDPSGKFIVVRNQTIDRNQFTVKAEITPVNSVTSVSTTTNYQKAVIGTMDTKKDLMATESSTQFSKAVLYFKGLYSKGCAEAGTSADASVMTNIEKSLKRTIAVLARVDNEKAGNVILTVEYQYTYYVSGGTYPTGIDATDLYSESIEASSIPKDDISNIYLFYNAPTVAQDPYLKEDTVKLSAESPDELNKLNALGMVSSQIKVFLIAQNSVDFDATPEVGYEKRAPGYKVNITADTIFNGSVKKLYTNIKNTELNATGISFATQNSLVDTETMNRIADIKVSIYQGSNLFAEVKGARTQN